MQDDKKQANENSSLPADQLIRAQVFLPLQEVTVDELTEAGHRGQTGFLTKAKLVKMITFSATILFLNFTWENSIQP